MTTQQLEQIAVLRQHNFPYSFIGRELDLSPNTVKSICRRKGFKTEDARKTKSEKTTAVLCKNCHKPLAKDARGDAVFCSDYCRSEWRRRNRKIIRK